MADPAAETLFLRQMLTEQLTRNNQQFAAMSSQLAANQAQIATLLADANRVRYASPPSPGSGIPSKPRLPTPKPYDPSTTPCLPTWLFALELWFVANRITQDECLPYVPTLLINGALIWYRACSEQRQPPGPPFDDWPSFKLAIRARFEPPDHVNNLRRKFWSLRQGSSHIQEYTASFQALLMQLPAMNAGDVLFRYQDGLADNLRELVAGARHTTYEAAAEQAAGISSARESYRPSSSGRRAAPPGFSHPPQYRSGATPMDLSAVQEDWNSEEDEPEPEPVLAAIQAAPRAAPLRVCRRCQKPGHSSPDCPSTVVVRPFGQPPRV